MRKLAARWHMHWRSCISSLRLAVSLRTAALIILASGFHLQAETASPKGTLAELMKVQHMVTEALPLARRALVGLETSYGMASGVIVSPEGLVLTAAHVVCDAKKNPQPGMEVKVFVNGKTSIVRGVALGMDVATDAAMIQLTGKRKDWPFVELHRGHDDIGPGTWCFALGHPGGFDEKRGDVLRVGKIIKTMPNGLQSDCVLMGGDSGGPLFSLKGDLIGIHSQIWEGRDQNVHVSLAPFLRSWNAMKDSEVVRAWSQGSGGWLGIATRESDDGLIEVESVADQSPAARAGLRSGDVLLSFNSLPVRSQPEFSTAVRARSAGETIVLQVRNRSGQRTVTVKLSQRPEE